MDTDSAPATSTPPGVRSLPVLGTTVGITGATLVGLRTVRAVRRLREAGATVPALRHRASLPGYGAPLVLVVIGDSAAAGHGLPDADAGLARQVGRRLAARTGRPVEVDSLAVDGATTAVVRETQVPQLRADAEVVLVGVGVNDAVRGRPARRVVGETRRLFGAVRDAAPSARVVVLTCPDLSSAPGLPGVLRPALGAACRWTARAQREVAEEMTLATAGADGHLPAAAFGRDGFHPGPRGVAILADRVDRALHTPDRGHGNAVTTSGAVSGGRTEPPGRGAGARRPARPTAA